MAEFDFARWAILAVGVVLVSALMVLASRDWRWTMVALGVQYAAVFVLVAGVWRVELAVVKLVAGWMATAILGASQEVANPASHIETDEERPSGAVFRVLTGGLVVLAVFSLLPETVTVLSRYLGTVPLPQLAGGMLLMGIGLVMLGLNARPLRVILALLVLFSGFEMLYAMVESATLVAGLLALVNLALALVGAYLHVVPTMDMETVK